MKTYVGEFEEIVLLTVASLGEKAYGLDIIKEIESRTQRAVSVGALYNTITRLTEKKYLRPRLTAPTHQRGGRRKNHFELTHQGKAAVLKTKQLRDLLWAISKDKFLPDEMKYNPSSSIGKPADSC